MSEDKNREIAEGISLLILELLLTEQQLSDKNKFIELVNGVPFLTLIGFDKAVKVFNTKFTKANEPIIKTQVNEGFLYRLGEREYLYPENDFENKHSTRLNHLVNLIAKLYF